MYQNILIFFIIHFYAIFTTRVLINYIFCVRRIYRRVQKLMRLVNITRILILTVC